MGKVLITEQHLQDIADAIRSKNGSEETYTPGEMAIAIEGIESDNGIKSIEIVSLPDKIQYDDGETIDYTGLTVRALRADGSVYTDETYPDGIIPLSDLNLAITTASKEGLIKTAASNLVTGLISLWPAGSIHEWTPASGGKRRQDYYSCDLIYTVYSGSKGRDYAIVSNQSSYIYTYREKNRNTWGEWNSSERQLNDSVTIDSKTAYYYQNYSIVSYDPAPPGISPKRRITNNDIWTAVYGDVGYRMNLPIIYPVEEEHIDVFVNPGDGGQGGGGDIESRTLSISENGTYDVINYIQVEVDVPSRPVLQTKFIARNGLVTPDIGYDGLSSVNVRVPAGGSSIPIISCGALRGSEIPNIEIMDSDARLNAKKLIVMAMNGDTDNKALASHVSLNNTSLTPTTSIYNEYSATGDNRINYRIDVYDITLNANDSIDINILNADADYEPFEHSGFMWAFIGTDDFIISKIVSALDAAVSDSNGLNGGVLYGILDGASKSPDTDLNSVNSNTYERDNTISTANPGSGYMGSYIIWLAESGASNIEVRQVGAFGGGAMNAASSLTVTINGYSGSYALISVCHRDTVATPEGCTLLDFTTYTSEGFKNYTSVYRCAVDSAAKSITFTQASSVRIGATVWVLDRDFTLTKTRTAEFGYYTSELSVESQALTYFTFSAPTAQTSGSASWAVSDGAWLCQAFPNAQQLRHFTGFIAPADQIRTSKIRQGTTESVLATAKAQVCVYIVMEAA